MQFPRETERRVGGRPLVPASSVSSPGAGANPGGWISRARRAKLGPAGRESWKGIVKFHKRKSRAARGGGEEVRGKQ